jgi:hypothetical protein
MDLTASETEAVGLGEGCVGCGGCVGCDVGCDGDAVCGCDFNSSAVGALSKCWVPQVAVGAAVGLGGAGAGEEGASPAMWRKGGRGEVEEKAGGRAWTTKEAFER